ncbi:MAG: tRNA 2-thiouridine(34) synthase MnmA [Clostridia bacterium]|nr:tRNA 2-thiouridine(34) synthase MnmA [Clostridia bacterium]MDD4386281.1 tRNA 2-thiouridine(34) synthase MnmA [Clostridia bacterium]
MDKTVLLAMSGGVDSTYALISLVKQGYKITGVTFKINNNANTIKSIEDASKIAKSYNIKHLVIDYTDIFKNEVIKYFIDTYKSGKTPNPCVICNKKIKFGQLDKLRKKLNLDYLATGHYANVENINGMFYLKKALNKKKDQSYFLNQISSNILQYCIFPLGSVQTKEYVKSILADNNIEILNKKESQEICFIEDNNCVKFLKEYIPENEGIIKNINNKFLGIHKGIYFYTIGQRRGLGISHDKPLFVKKIDIYNNEVIVAEEKDLYTDNITIKNINILAPEFLNKKLVGKIRYRSDEYEIEDLQIINAFVSIKFKEKQKSVTPGQYLVAYYNEYLVFGGEIT